MVSEEQASLPPLVKNLLDAFSDKPVLLITQSGDILATNEAAHHRCSTDYDNLAQVDPCIMERLCPEAAIPDTLTCTCPPTFQESVSRRWTIRPVELPDTPAPALMLICDENPALISAEQTIDQLHNLMVVITRDGSIPYLNRRTRQFMGLTDDEKLTVQAALQKFVPETMQTEAWTLFRAVIDGHIPIVSEYEIEMNDAAGNPRWIRWDNSLIKDEQGGILGILATGTDISENRRLQRHLQWQNRVNSTLATLQGPLIAFDEPEEITSAVLDAARKLTGSEHGYVSIIDRESGANIGYTLTEMLKGVCKVDEAQQRIAFPPDENGVFRGLYGHSLNTGLAFYLNEDVQKHVKSVGTPDGHIPLKNFLSVPAMSEGEVVGQIALSNAPHDYTDAHLDAVKRLADMLSLAIERMHIQEALKRSEDRYRQLADLTFEGILLHNNHIVIDCNVALCRMTGYSREEIIGQDLLALTIPEEWKQVVRDSVQYERTAPYQVEIQRKDGTRFPAELEARQLAPNLRVGAIRDITLRQKAEARRLELILERERSQILANFIRDASHEFRTPLSVINTNIALLKYIGDREQQTKLHDKIGESVQRITRLVDQLLVLSRLDQAATLEQQTIDFRTLLQQAIEHTDQTYTGQITVDIQDNLPVVQGSMDDLFDALTELLHNAHRHGNGQQVTIRAFNGDNAVKIEIEDHGSGMDPEHLAHIFERFYRGDTAHTTAGFGLGLPIVRRIIELHKGEIEVETGPEYGTRFRLHLPGSDNPH